MTLCDLPWLYIKPVLISLEKKQLGALLETVNKSKLNFSYEVLEKATNYFHDSNKLGQGGNGSVYKVMCDFLTLHSFL